MKRTLARLATLALALPLAVGTVAGSAQAITQTVPVPGCFGAVSNDLIVCDLTVTVQTPDPAFSTIDVKLCVSTCYNVPVTSVTTTGTTRLCYSYKNGAGTPTNGCASNWLPGVALDLYLVEYFTCSSTESVCVDA